MLKSKSVIAWIFLLCMILTSCQSQERRKPKVETTMVRLYEVIPVPEHSEAYGKYQYQYPVVRAGLEYGISMDNENKASFTSAIGPLEARSGLEIEHVILGSWEELRQELQEARGDGTTKLVLFDNSYDQSLIKEAMNGGYIDFSALMEEAGIYESEDYQQAVLQAGQIGSQQLLVPVLYNVAGIGAEAKEYTSETPSYSQLLDMLQDAANGKTADSQLSVVSKAMLDHADPDLFWNAAGQPWDGYERQQEFFERLYEYVTKYDSKETELKSNWAIFISQYDDELQKLNDKVEVTEKYLTQDELLSVGLGNEEEFYLWHSLYGNSSYYVECTGAESEPYHSVVGTIHSITGYYPGEFITKENGGFEINCDFGYWPIQMYNDEGYAAQPFCYVAAMNDGDEEAAFKVIQEMMQQSFSLAFGFSVYEPAWRENLEKWINTDHYQFKWRGRYVFYNENTSKWVEQEGAFLGNSMDMLGEERKKQIGEVLLNQLDNIQYAQIADREVMTIWQDTLAECVDSGLSAEAGFAMLCERMDAFCK